MRRFTVLAASAGAALAGLLMTAHPAAAASVPTKVTIIVKPTGAPAAHRHADLLAAGGTHQAPAEAGALFRI